MEAKVKIVDGTSKKTGRAYHALVARITDDAGNVWESEFLFPRWHKLGADGRPEALTPFGADRKES